MKRIILLLLSITSLLTFSSMASDFNETLQAAKSGDDSAQVNIGVMYENGLGVHQDYQEAINWYLQAAQLGNVDAKLYLGAMYENGKGVSQDYKQAVKWIREAGAQGYTRAKMYLGLLNEKIYFEINENNQLFAQVTVKRKLF